MTGIDIFYSLLPLIIVNSVFILAIIVFAFLYPKRKKSEDVLRRMHPTFVGVFQRELWYWLNQPLLALFKFLKLTPNMVTGISLVLGFISAYCYMSGMFALAGWILILSATLDILDGWLARQTGQESPEGAFFDSCVDRYSEGAVFLGITLFYAINGNIIMYGVNAAPFIIAISIIALIGSQIVSYAKARGESVGSTTNAGLMQRPERVVLLSVVSVFYPFLQLLMSHFGFNEHYPMVLVILLMAILTNISAAVRIIVLFKEIRRKSRQDG